MRHGLILCGILAAPAAWAQEAPPLLGLRVMASPTGPIWLGQHVGVTAILRTQNRFGSPPAFPEPLVTGRAVVLPNGTTTPGSEREGGISYVLLQHRYDVFPLQAGVLEFAALRMAVPVAGADGGILQAEASSEALRIEIRLPPGTLDPARVATTPALRLDTRMEGDPTRVAVGDAITRHVVLNAQDTAAMLLPAMPWAAPDGMRVYSDPPRLSDTADRGVLSATREDSAAFVPQRPGRYQLPGASFQWFNPASGQMRQIEVPALTVEAVPAPVEASGAPRRLLLPGLVVLLAGAAAWLANGRGVFRRLGRYWRRPAPAEAQAFKALRKACRQNQPQAACAALMRWSALAMPAGERPTLRQLSRLSATPELEVEGGRLMAHCFAAPHRRAEGLETAAPPWTGHALLAAVRTARSYLRLPRQGFRATPGLPPLNPGGGPPPTPRVALPRWAR
jgi:hypothetical protein